MINDDFILVGSVLDSEPDSEISLYVASINCPSQPPPGSFEGCAISIETNCSGSPVTVLCTSRKYWHTCITTSISIASILTVLWSFIECEESAISIDSKLSSSYDYYNGLRGELGHVRVCHEGKQIHICPAEEESFNFDIDQVVTDFCQNEGYNCEFFKILN